MFDYRAPATVYPVCGALIVVLDRNRKYISVSQLPLLNKVWYIDRSEYLFNVLLSLQKN